MRAGREETQFALSKFDPLLLEVTQDWVSGKLPVDQYPYVRPPTVRPLRPPLPAPSPPSLHCSLQPLQSPANAS